MVVFCAAWAITLGDSAMPAAITRAVREMRFIARSFAVGLGKLMLRLLLLG